MSGLFRLGWKDLIKGAVVTVLSSVLSMVLDSLNGMSPFDLKKLGVIALSTFVGYLLKQLVTDEQGKLAGKI